MRLALICIVSAALIGSQSWWRLAEEAPAERGSGFETLLITYLENGLEGAGLGLKRLRESGTATVSDLSAAEDEVDRWRLYLRLAAEGKLIGLHPVLSELRREFGVPEPIELADAGRREAISVAIREYIQKKLARAQQASERAQALYSFGRGTESDVLAANRRVEGLKLLLEADKLDLREEKQ